MFYEIGELLFLFFKSIIFGEDCESVDCFKNSRDVFYDFKADKYIYVLITNKEKKKIENAFIFRPVENPGSFNAEARKQSERADDFG